MRLTGLVCSIMIALGLVLLAPAPARANFAVGISVGFAPPPLPVYAQPLCPAPGYLWTPGYWAYSDAGYYWVPGTWVLPPVPGLLWTPGYWAFNDGVYLWNAGYWGPSVGFYGGIDYGFGYPGVGFFGGYWSGQTFFYNRAVTHIDFHVIGHVYDRPVYRHHSAFDRVSFNGGRYGLPDRPTARELAAMYQTHFLMTSAQTRLIEAARSDPALLASRNHGRPEVAAIQRPGEYHGNFLAAARMETTRSGNQPARQQASVNRERNQNLQARERAYQQQALARQRAQFRNLQARQEMSRSHAHYRQPALYQRAQQRQFTPMQTRPIGRSFAWPAQRLQQRQMPRFQNRGFRPEGEGRPHGFR